MIARLALYALVVSLPLAVMAELLDRAAAWRGWRRRWIWAAALVGTVGLTAAVPIREMLVTPTSLNPVTERASISPHLFARVAAEPSLRSSWDQWRDRADQLIADVLAIVDRAEPFVIAIWLAGVIAGVCVFGVGRVALGRRRRAWRRDVVAGVPVLIAPDDGPAVVGVASPEIVIPEWALMLEARSIELLLRHEREHQRARDPILIHAAGLAWLVMPWHPVAWWMWSRLRLAVELDCDARVLRANSPADPRTYGELLLAVVSRRSPRRSIVAPAMLERTSTLTRRIAAMYPTRFRLSRTRATMAGGVAAGLFAAAILIPIPTLYGAGEAKRLAGDKSAPAFKAPTAATERERLGQYFPNLGSDRTAVTRISRDDRGQARAVTTQESVSVVYIQNSAGQIIGTSNTRVLERVLKMTKPEGFEPEHKAEVQMTEAQAREARAREEREKAERGVATERRPSIGEQKSEEQARAEMAEADRQAAELVKNLVAVDVIRYAAGDVSDAALSVFYITIKDQKK